MKDLCILIMAAGKGTRMVSKRAKVLHRVCGVPMLLLVYRAAEGLEPEELLVVVGHDADRVRAALGGLRATFIVQQVQLGTGHAVMAARKQLEGRPGSVLVLSGDTPRIKAETLFGLVDRHRRSSAATTLLTAHMPEPSGYGRIVRNPEGEVAAIIEEKDATPEQKRITEINAAIYCFEIPSLLEALEKLSNDNAQQEYYLTDIVEIQRREGKRINAILHQDNRELQGINSRLELADISQALWREKNLQLMASGVTIMDPDRTYIDLDVVVEQDVILYPQVTLEGNTLIGAGSTIHSGSRIANSRLGPGVEVQDSCLIRDAEIGRETRVGPYAHLRDGVFVGENCRIGNFVEIKNSTIGPGTQAAHLAYLGDATVGKNVIVGAGAITCNFDGERKHATIIEDAAFIGTSAQLIAPLRIGRGAVVAAGSCITEDVQAGALAIARERQMTKPGWVQQRKERKGPS